MEHKDYKKELLTMIERLVSGSSGETCYRHTADWLFTCRPGCDRLWDRTLRVPVANGAIPSARKELR